MKSRKLNIHPIKNALLVQVLKHEEQKTAEGLIIPDSAPKDLARGRILQVGHDLAASSVARAAGLVPGSVVLFFDKAKENVAIGSDQALIPESSLLAVEMPERGPEPSKPSDFFALPDWKEFKGTDYHAWEEFQNIRIFNIKLRYLEPFHDLGPVIPAVHKQLVLALAGVESLEMNYVRYEKDKQTHQFKIVDDTWDGLFHITESDNIFSFTKVGTSIENLHLTLPTLLTAFQQMMQVPQFRAILGSEYNQVTDLVIRFHQRIHLEGKGTAKTPIRNSDLMQQFLRLLPARGDAAPATLEALGFDKDDLGRIDLKFSFEKDIAGHPFRVFATIEAPANDAFRLIDVEWEIQDLKPGDLDERKYGPVFSEFFRNVVVRSFYHRWFKDPHDVVCTTLKA